MKIVKVRHFGDSKSKEFIYETSRALKKDDMVLVAPKHGKYENYAVCTTDSIEVKKEVLEFLQTQGAWELPLCKVIGKFELNNYGEAKR